MGIKTYGLTMTNNRAHGWSLSEKKKKKKEENYMEQPNLLHDDQIHLEKKDFFLGKASTR